MFLIPKPEVVWRSPWRIEQERRRAEDMGERKFVTAPQIAERQKKVRKRGERRAPAQFCEGCGKGMRKGCKNSKCHKCFTDRPRCVCGRTIFKNNSLTQCKQCFASHNRARCPLCDAKLNARNGYGLCKPHYQKYRRHIHQEQLSICSDCPRLINRDNRFGRCMKCSRTFYNRDQRLRAKELKEAA